MPKIIKDGRTYGAAPSTLADLSDTTVSSPTNNQVLKYDASTQKWVNGVGSAVISCSQTEYDAWKTAGTLNDETMYVITDAPNLNATAQDISYDGSTDTVWDKVEAKANTASLATVATSGKYKDLIGLSTALHTGSSVVEAGGSINLSESPTNFMYLLVRFQTNAECQYMLMGTTDTMSLQVTLSGHSSQGTATYPLAYNSTIGVKINGNKLDVTNLTYNNANYKARVSNVWGIIRTNA